MRKCNEEFSQFTGSENTYRCGLSIVTEGVLAVAQETKSFWFLDIISSHQIYKSVRNTPHQVWKLIRIKDDKFKAICEDGNNNVVTSQDITFSDFKYDEYVVWLIGGVIMLPSEY